MLNTLVELSSNLGGRAVAVAKSEKARGLVRDGSAPNEDTTLSPHYILRARFIGPLNWRHSF